jgi:murein L,D-transpeptidase YafK
MEDLPGNPLVKQRAANGPRAVALSSMSLPAMMLIAGLCMACISIPDSARADAQPSLPVESSAQLDRQTRAVLSAIINGDLPRANAHAEQLVQHFPRFALGQLLHAELLAVSGLQAVQAADQFDFSPALINLLLEAQARLAPTDAQLMPAAAPVNSNRLLPAELIQVGRHIDTVVLVELARSQLYVFDTRTDTPALIKQHYISSGSGGFGKLLEGDLKTPLGIYTIQGFRSNASLPDLYGSGALMLDYPNPLDTRLGRTGSGIWLHGVPPDRMSRAPRSSEGCVTMGNDYLIELRHQLEFESTHVILTDQVEWVTADRQAEERQQYRELFVQYRDNRVVEPQESTTRRVATDGANSNSIPPTGRTLQALAKVPADAISILRNPSLHGAGDAAEQLVMTFELEPPMAGKITLYWQKTASQPWRIIEESLVPAGV